METGRGGRDGAFVAGKDALKVLEIARLRLAADEAGHGSLAQGIQIFLKLFVVAVVEEAQRAAAARRVVDHLGHDRVVFAKVELVANAYLAGGVDEHVPQAQLAVELAEQKHLDARARLFLVAIEAGGKHLGVIEYKNVMLVEIIEHLLEHLVFDVSRLPVEHHHAALVAVGRGIFRNLLLGELELEL